MLRLRITASLLSMLSLAMMTLAYLTGAPATTSIALLAAAISLFSIAPFDAPSPRQRIRVVVACVVHVVGVAAGLASIYATPDFPVMTLGLVGLLLAGVGITLWAFATRRRRRMPQYMRYYTN